MARGELFGGLRFRLFGFDEDPALEEELRKGIKTNGGKMEIYEWENVYVITASSTILAEDPICLDAGKKGAIVVNEIWLVDCLADKSLADKTKALYKPPVSHDAIDGAAYATIGYSGFSAQESSYIEKMIDMMGACSANGKDKSTCTYMIFKSLEGPEYEEAKARRALCITMKWLEACVDNWKLVSIDNYNSMMPCQHKSRNYRTTKKAEDDSGSPDSSSPLKRQSIGPKKPPPPSKESARRCLALNWKQLSGYGDSEMVVTIIIPESTMQKTVAREEFKAALLGSFRRLANTLSDGECIANKFTADNFKISLVSDEVKLDGVQLVPYDEQLAQNNKEQFVLMVKEHFKTKLCFLPDDLAGWLYSMASGVPNKLLKNHILMQPSCDIWFRFLALFSIMLKLREENSVVKYKEIVDHKRMKVYKSWKKKTHQTSAWKVLYQSFTYIHPEKLEIQKLKKQIPGLGAQSSCCKPKERNADVFGLSELFRDCFTHPAMLYQEQLLPIVLTTTFPNLLSDLQQVLFVLGYLNHLK